MKVGLGWVQTGTSVLQQYWILKISLISLLKTVVHSCLDKRLHDNKRHNWVWYEKYTFKATNLNYCIIVVSYFYEKKNFYVGVNQLINQYYAYLFCKTMLRTETQNRKPRPVCNRSYLIRILNWLRQIAKIIITEIFW